MGWEVNGEWGGGPSESRRLSYACLRREISLLAFCVLFQRKGFIVVVSPSHGTRDLLFYFILTSADPGLVPVLFVARVPGGLWGCVWALTQLVRWNPQEGTLFTLSPAPSGRWQAKGPVHGEKGPCKVSELLSEDACSETGQLGSLPVWQQEPVPLSASRTAAQGLFFASEVYLSDSWLGQPGVAIISEWTKEAGNTKESYSPLNVLHPLTQTY